MPGPSAKGPASGSAPVRRAAQRSALDDFSGFSFHYTDRLLGAVWPPRGHLYSTAMKTAFRARYANGVELTCRTQAPGFGARFEGTAGWVQYTYDKIEASSDSIKNSEIGPNEIHLPVSDNHYRNWLDCIKSRGEPIEPVEIGHRTASICHCGNIAMRLKRKVQWDPAMQTFPHDSEANQMLRRSYREPWRL